MSNEEQLQGLLARHGHTLAPLLGPLWPVRPFKTEQFGSLTKYTLGQLPDGRWAMLHRLGGPDHPHPHCHPCLMESLVIEGCYWDYRYVEGRIEETLRVPGVPFIIQPETVHRIAELPAGDCWTLVFAGPVVRAWRHYPELAA